MDSVPCDIECLPTCDGVFQRVTVAYTIVGGTRIGWRMKPTYQAPGPLTFQVEYSATAGIRDVEWTAVGDPVVDGYCTVDDLQRMFGQTNTARYRVRVTDGDGNESVSDPVGNTGGLSPRDWFLGRQLVRQYAAQFRVGRSAQRGWLFKSIPKTDESPCVDPQTGEVMSPDGGSCDEIECDYHFPVECVYADFSLFRRNTEQQVETGTGTYTDWVAGPAAMLGAWMPEAYDVWASAVTGDRFIVTGEVEDRVTIRGVPILIGVTLKKLAYSHPAYQLGLPNWPPGC